MTPHSHAIWLIGLPLLLTSCTASSLNSRVYPVTIWPGPPPQDWTITELAAYLRHSGGTTETLLSYATYMHRLLPRMQVDLGRACLLHLHAGAAALLLTGDLRRPAGCGHFDRRSGGVGRADKRSLLSVSFPRRAFFSARTRDTAAFPADPFLRGHALA